MIKRPFREHHLLSLLEEYEQQSLPLDLFISNYFRAHKALGPKDRGEITETIYGMIRWQGLLDYLADAPISWEKRLTIYSKNDLKEYLTREDIPLHIRLSFPEILFNLIKNSYGEDKASDLCQISNTRAPTVVRINSMKTTRDEMLNRWKEQYDVGPSQFSEHGIIFYKKINFFSLPEFQAGLFEIQDEGSQLLANMIEAVPGQQVMDYCAGSGGKTLAFAHKMQNKGQIFLHDVRPYILQECRKRLRRAGIQNSQTVEPEDVKLKKLKKKMDWVLVDAPCTGTGTMRRNPDMKWKFTESTLTNLIGLQRSIFEKALSYLHPKGHIVYSTCSLLKEENEEQMNHFIKTYNLEVVGDVFHSFPSVGGMDGFFGVTFRKAG